MATLCTMSWKKGRGDVKKPVKELEWLTEGKEKGGRISDI